LQGFQATRDQLANTDVKQGPQQPELGGYTLVAADSTMPGKALGTYSTNLGKTVENGLSNSRRPRMSSQASTVTNIKLPTFNLSFYWNDPAEYS